MMVSGLQDYQDFLADYAAELLRWNQRINLVSRQDTENLLQDLFRQCVGGAQALLTQLDKEGWLESGCGSEVEYFDLGSGGGLPGVIWNEVFSRQMSALRTSLVEPREKRAWFLERLAGQASLGPFSVLEGRWGEVRADSSTPKEASLAIISLKALHLTDPEVLSGLAEVNPDHGPRRVVIARYYPSDQKLDAELMDKLLIPKKGVLAAAGRGTLAAASSRVLSWTEPGPREASLVLSLYDLASS